MRRVAIQVDVVNRLEELTIADQVFEVDENVEAWQYIGKIDVTFDSQRKLDFTLTGGYPFGLDRRTGHVYALIENWRLDYETSPELNFTISVSDGISIRSARMTVRLRDVNESPILWGSIPIINVFSDSSATHSVAADTFIDPEGTHISYRLQQVSGERLPSWLQFDGTTNALTVQAAQGSVGSYLLQLVAADESGLESHENVALRVFDASFPWYNPMTPLDVNDDGFISPLDALIVINLMNSDSVNLLPSANPNFKSFVDTNRDGVVVPLDLLLVINYLNGPGGEGESDVRSSLETDLRLTNLDVDLRVLDRRLKTELLLANTT
jgi:hypothetical protein